MTWSNLATFTSVPGSITFAVTEISADSNFLVYAPDINEVDVQSHGVLLIQVFNFDIGGEYMTVFSLNCYTRVEAALKPLPILGSLNVRVGYYAGLKTKPRSIQLWTET